MLHMHAHRLTHAHTCTPYMKHSAHHRHVLFFHRTRMSQPTNARSPSSSNVQYCAPRLRPHCNTARRDCGRIINDAPRLRTLLVLVPDRARRAPRLQVVTCVARIYSIWKRYACYLTKAAAWTERQGWAATAAAAATAEQLAPCLPTRLRPAISLLPAQNEIMEIVHYPPCRTEGRRDELQSQPGTQHVEVPCVGTIPRKPRIQTRRDDTACVVGERELNSC